MFYIPVAGTWWKRGDSISRWYRVGSLFDKVVSALGYKRVDQNGDLSKPDKGFWSGHVNGLMLQRLMWWRDNHPAWKTGGEALRRFLIAHVDEFKDGVTLFLHSHGGQVGVYALEGLSLEMAQKLQIRVVTCDMPIRKDMTSTYRAAAWKVVSWTHLYSEKGWKSKMRWLGDGALFSNPRELEVATKNIEVKGGHSGYLFDPNYIGQWQDILGEAA